MSSHECEPAKLCSGGSEIGGANQALLDKLDKYLKWKGNAQYVGCSFQETESKKKYIFRIIVLMHLSID